MPRYGNEANFSCFLTFQTLKCSISQNIWAKPCGFIRGIHVLLLNIPDTFYYLSQKHRNVTSYTAKIFFSYINGYWEGGDFCRIFNFLLEQLQEFVLISNWLCSKDPTVTGEKTVFWKSKSRNPTLHGTFHSFNQMLLLWFVRSNLLVFNFNWPFQGAF